MSDTNEKVTAERDVRIVEHFLRAEGIPGRATPNEKPDIDCQLDDRLVGIELTELVPYDGLTRLPNLNRLLMSCKRRHEDRQLPYARVFVNFDANTRLKKTRVDRLGEILVDRIAPSIVRVHEEKESIRLEDLNVDGIISVDIHLPIDNRQETTYPLMYIVDVETMSIDDIKNSIQRKEKKLLDYRTEVDEHWLLIHFGHHPSEKWFVGPTPDLFKEFPISSSFERVYLFTPGIEHGTWLISGDAD